MPKDYFLSPKESDYIFKERILPRSGFENALPSDCPTIIILGGQPGSGKTTITDKSLSELNFNAVLINMDELRINHPQYENVLKSNPNASHRLLIKDTTEWLNKLMTLAVKKKVNMVWENTLGSETKTLRDNFKMLNRAGYELDVRVMAVPQVVSQIGVYGRYNQEVKDKDVGRLVGINDHDIRYKNLPDNLALIESEKLAGSLKLFGRNLELKGPEGTKLIYSNELVNDNWLLKPNAKEAVNEERNRTLSNGEKKVLKEYVNEIKKGFSERNESLFDLLKVLPEELKNEKKPGNRFKL